VDLVVAASTLWVLFGLVLFLPLVQAPRPFERAAAVLLTLQFVAMLASGYGTAEAWTVASYDLPVLALVLIATAVAHGVRSHRRARRLTR
jgi:hypothetical protein